MLPVRQCAACVPGKECPPCAERRERFAREDEWMRLPAQVKDAEISAMTERALRHVEDTVDGSDPHDPVGYHSDLIATVRRLRALIDEKANKFDFCVWCGREMPYGDRHGKSIEHTHDCPAAHPDGRVR